LARAGRNSPIPAAIDRRYAKREPAMIRDGSGRFAAFMGMRAPRRAGERRRRWM